MDAASASTEISGRRAFQLDAMTPQRFDERLGEVIRYNDAAGGDTEEVAAERGCVILPDAKHLYSQSLEKSQERCVGQDLIVVAESRTTHIDISGEERSVVRCCVKSVAGQGHHVAVDDVQVCVEVHLTLLVPSVAYHNDAVRSQHIGLHQLIDGLLVGAQAASDETQVAEGKVVAALQDGTFRVDAIDRHLAEFPEKG